MVFIVGSIPDAQYRVGKGAMVRSVQHRADRSAPAQHYARDSLCCSAISTVGWFRNCSAKQGFAIAKRLRN